MGASLLIVDVGKDELRILRTKFPRFVARDIDHVVRRVRVLIRERRPSIVRGVAIASGQPNFEYRVIVERGELVQDTAAALAVRAEGTRVSVGGEVEHVARRS